MAKAKTSNKNNTDLSKVRGFYRLQIEEDGKVVGDSGWRENTVTNTGFLNYVVYPMIANGGSKLVGYAMLGTGGAPASNATSIAGEVKDASNARCAVTPTAVASATAQFAFTLASGVYTTSHDISNIALIDVSATGTDGPIFAGNTYASSTLASNQSVNGTYQIRFANA